jgi:hypothetical protein
MKAKITKDQIIAELKRIAFNNGGQPPGMKTFEIESGFPRSSWRGIYWSKWSDVQSEAGFTPNQASQRVEDYQIYEMLVPLCRSLKKLPTLADMMLWRRRENPNFPVQVIQG